MPSHTERRQLPYTAQQVFDLVADVDKYPEFLPWCVAARVKDRHENQFWAELVIGFKMLRERYSCKVILHPHEKIDISYLDGPFKYLTNNWKFMPAPEGGTVIEFYIEFEFRSRLLQGVIGAFFGDAVRMMVSAFERRARDLYGPGGRAALESPQGGGS